MRASALLAGHKIFTLLCMAGDCMLSTLLVIIIAMFPALGAALHFAYRETEADFPLRRQPHRGKT